MPCARLWERRKLISEKPSLCFRGTSTCWSTAVSSSSRVTDINYHPSLTYISTCRRGCNRKKYFSLWFMSCFHLMMVFPEPIHQSQYFNQSVRSATQIFNNQAILQSVIVCFTKWKHQRQHLCFCCERKSAFRGKLIHCFS